MRASLLPPLLMLLLAAAAASAHHPRRAPHVPFVSDRVRARLASQPATLADDLPPPPVFAARSDYRVAALPDIELPADYELYAGHLPVNGSRTTEFFMYFERTARPTRDLIVWLNGGPGASSLFGLFVENGPLAFTADGNITHNPWGWHRAANVLFLENPAGVGFSRADDVAHTIHDVGEQFWAFSQAWQQVFGHYRWWITGESFGGMYVPHIADHILNHNAASPASKIDLQGLAIGNGAFFSPTDIPVNWIDYFDRRNLLLSARHRDELLGLRNACSRELADAKRFADRDVPHCLALTDRFTNTTYMLDATLGKHCLPTFYDVRVTECNQGDPTDPANEHAQRYLARHDVQLALHAIPADYPHAVPWTWLSLRVYENLYWNGDEPSVHLLPKLAAQMPVLLYNGDADIICNHVGMEETLQDLEWGGRKGFRHRHRRPFILHTVEGDENELTMRWHRYGEYQRERGITYMKVYEAGHMVPFNQPQGSLAMIRAFLRGWI